MVMLNIRTSIALNATYDPRPKFRGLINIKVLSSDFNNRGVYLNNIKAISIPIASKHMLWPRKATAANHKQTSMLTAVAKRQIEATVIRKYRLKTSLVKKRGALIDATNLHNANGRAVLPFDRLHKAGTLARHIEPRKPIT